MKNHSFFVVIVILYGCLLITNALVSLRRLARNAPKSSGGTILIFRNTRNSAGVLALAYLVFGCCLVVGGAVYLALH